MADTRSTLLADALVQANAGWLVRKDSPEQLTRILSEIDELSALLTKELSSPRDVFAEMLAEPRLLRPLTQLFATPTSTPIRAAAHCIIRGWDVKSINLAYELKRAVSLTVVVEHVGSGETHQFNSNNIYDVELVQHIGIMTLSGKPVMTGFYPFMD
jgi:hypothetical protein